MNTIKIYDDRTLSITMKDMEDFVEIEYKAYHPCTYGVYHESPEIIRICHDMRIIEVNPYNTNCSETLMNGKELIKKEGGITEAIQIWVSHFLARATKGEKRRAEQLERHIENEEKTAQNKSEISSLFALMQQTILTAKI